MGFSSLMIYAFFFLRLHSVMTSTNRHARQNSHLIRLIPFLSRSNNYQHPSLSLWLVSLSLLFFSTQLGFEDRISLSSLWHSIFWWKHWTSHHDVFVHWHLKINNDYQTMNSINNSATESVGMTSDEPWPWSFRSILVLTICSLITILTVLGL